MAECEGSARDALGFLDRLRASAKEGRVAAEVDRAIACVEALERKRREAVEARDAAQAVAEARVVEANAALHGAEKREADAYADGWHDGFRRGRDSAVRALGSHLKAWALDGEPVEQGAAKDGDAA